MTLYQAFHHDLLTIAYNNLIKQGPFNTDAATAEDIEFIEQLQKLIEAFPDIPPYLYEEGQNLMTRLVRAYPQLTHLVARDLFWFFGGDCLHFLSDEEIEKFQTLDERRYEAEEAGKEFDLIAERTRLFGSHK